MSLPEEGSLVAIGGEQWIITIDAVENKEVFLESAAKALLKVRLEIEYESLYGDKFRESLNMADAFGLDTLLEIDSS